MVRRTAEKGTTVAGAEGATVEAADQAQAPAAPARRTARREPGHTRAKPPTPRAERRPSFLDTMGPLPERGADQRAGDDHSATADRLQTAVEHAGRAYGLARNGVRAGAEVASEVAGNEVVQAVAGKLLEHKGKIAIGVGAFMFPVTAILGGVAAAGVAVTRGVQHVNQGKSPMEALKAVAGETSELYHGVRQMVGLDKPEEGAVVPPVELPKD